MAHDIIEQSEVAMHDAAHGKEDKDDKRRLKIRHRDVPDALHRVHAVYTGGFHDFRVDRHDRSKVDDRIVSGALPQLDHDDKPRPHFWIRIRRPARHAHLNKNPVQEAVVVVEHVVYDQPYKNRRDEVRKQHDSLRHLLEHAAGDFVYEYCKEDGKEIIEKQEGKVVQDRVASEHPQLAGTEQELEVGEPHELALEYACTVVEFDECHIQPRKRCIVEGDEEHDRRNAHDDQGPVFPYVAAEQAEPALACFYPIGRCHV